MKTPAWVPRIFAGWYAQHELTKRRAAHHQEVEATIQKYGPMKIGDIFQERLDLEAPPKSSTANHGIPERLPFPVKAYTPPSGVAPAEHVLAMDDQMTNLYGTNNSMFTGLGFPGFPYLTELTQITEYRDMSERAANEMVRKWVKLRSISKGDKADRILALEAAMKKHCVRELFRQCAILDGFMGRAQLFVDLGDIAGLELKTPLMLNRFKVAKDSLRGFKVVEPITTYPANYNSTNPLASNYYVPSSWFVYGQEVHASRLLQFISRPLPDLLKPAYNFSGMSLSQLGQPYVDYWLNTRDSVGKLLRNFSTTVLTTDMSDALSGGSSADIFGRMRLFTQFRDNQGIFMLDKGREETITQINTPLSGLDKLQAQAQEHMAAVAKTPLVILLGITPTGLNSSAEGDIRVFYSYIADQQEAIFRRNLETVLKVLMLNEFGEVDDDIAFDFAPLFEMSDKEHADIRKLNADEATALSALGAVSPEEVRARLALSPDSGWDNLDTDALALELSAETEVETGVEAGVDPAAAVTEDPAAGGLQEVSLNGAQISSLLSIIESVVSGIVPKASGIKIVSAAFPSVPKATINEIFEPLVVNPGAVAGAEKSPSQKQAPAPAPALVQASAQETAPDAKMVPPASPAADSEPVSASDSAAYALMADALALDGFFGNQHTGSVGAPKDHPYLAAQKSSTWAQRATNKARHENTKASHDLAARAHRRAYASHVQALKQANPQAAAVHEAYKTAHKSAIEAHTKKNGE